ncbi:MAG TPA: hypothetical protein VIA29_02995 [Thermoanaerobaculia bacterium]
MTTPFILLGLVILALVVFELRRGKRKPPAPPEEPEHPDDYGG